jgi:hypothetical protein
MQKCEWNKYDKIKWQHKMFLSHFVEITRPDRMTFQWIHVLTAFDIVKYKT